MTPEDFSFPWEGLTAYQAIRLFLCWLIRGARPS